MKKQTAIKAKDPVCGMQVDQEKTAAISVHKGNTYYFCNPGCKAQFDKEPETLLEEGPKGMLWVMREHLLGIFKKKHKEEIRG